MEKSVKASKRERLEKIASDWLVAKLAFDNAKKRLGDVRELVDKEMGKRVFMFTESYAVSLPNLSRSSIDAKKLRREHPKIAKAYSKEIEYRELTISKREDVAKRRKAA